MNIEDYNYIIIVQADDTAAEDKLNTVKELFFDGCRDIADNAIAVYSTLKMEEVRELIKKELGIARMSSVFTAKISNARMN